MNAFALQNDMISVFWPTKQSVLRRLGLGLLGSLVIALSAQLSIPLTPVPISLQSFAVMLVGCLLGWRLGVLSIIFYLLEGAAGLPVFAGWGFGLQVFYGPTAGYLWGFIPAVVVSGFLLEKGMAKTKLTAFIAALVGDFFILAFGVLFLASLIGFKQAIVVGLQPFVLVELVKLGLLAVIIPNCWK